MTKRLIDVDDELLAAAQRATGERTLKGTVREALEQVVTVHRTSENELRGRWEAVGDLVADLHDPEVMDRAWS